MKQSEEIILSLLGVTWVLITYFISCSLGLTTDICVQITIYNLLWIVILYLLWKKESVEYTWPIFLGGLVAAWTPILTGYAQKTFNRLSLSIQVYLPLPWYASWYFKLMLVLTVVMLGYIYLLLSLRLANRAI